MCKALACCCKCILVLVAIVMLIVGIVLTVGGAFLLWGMKLLLKSIAPVMTQLNDLLKSIGVKQDAQTIIDFLSSNTNILGGIAFAIGVVLVIVSLLLIIAMCCCSKKPLYIVLVVLLSAIAIALIVTLAFYASGPEERVMKPLQVYFQKNIIDKYQGLNATNTESLVVNILQIRLQCCGLINSKDFATAKDFNRDIIVPPATTPTTIQFPLSCCNFKQDFTISDTDYTACVNLGVSDRINNGCWPQMKSQMGSYLNYVFISMGILIAVLVAVIIVLLFFICCMDKFE